MEKRAFLPSINVLPVVGMVAGMKTTITRLFINSKRQDVVFVFISLIIRLSAYCSHRPLLILNSKPALPQPIPSCISSIQVYIGAWQAVPRGSPGPRQTPTILTPTTSFNMRFFLLDIRNTNTPHQHTRVL